jgi:hypothetical protein
MTTPQEPAPDTEPDGTGTDDTGSTSAEDVEADGPLDADEGDPELDSYPG